jgi:hypothetical protein
MRQGPLAFGEPGNAACLPSGGFAYIQGGVLSSQCFGPGLTLRWPAFANGGPWRGFLARKRIG